MPMTYETDRGVWFNPSEIRLAKCLKCATPTNRLSPREITVAERAGYGQIRLVKTRNVLTLCEKCDARWELAMGIGIAGIALPITLPMGLLWLDVKFNLDVSGSLIGFSFLAAFVLGIVMYIYALRVSIRVRSIDDDGLVGLDKIHTDVRREIVEMGDAYKADHA
ncbi:MAG TPA: hypothetical protein VGM90_07885 [Kofleriaceae bacterium]|jgi:hypothetical protein